MDSTNPIRVPSLSAAKVFIQSWSMAADTISARPARSNNSHSTTLCKVQNLGVGLWTHMPELAHGRWYCQMQHSIPICDAQSVSDGRGNVHQGRAYTWQRQHSVCRCDQCILFVRVRVVKSIAWVCVFSVYFILTSVALQWCAPSGECDVAFCGDPIMALCVVLDKSPCRLCCVFIHSALLFCVLPVH